MAAQAAPVVHLRDFGRRGRAARQDTDADDEEVEALTCPLCLDLPEDKIVQCVNGHIFCEGCMKTHRDASSGSEVKCPTCRVVLGGTEIRNRIAEAAVSKMPGNCKGCGHLMLRHDIKAHEQTCGEVMIPCTFPGCTAQVKRKDMEEHHRTEAANHCALAKALADELQAKKELLATVDVKIKLKVLGHPSRSCTVKLFEPLDEQAAYSTALEGLSRTAHGFLSLVNSALDTHKTPHELGLRDGETLDFNVERQINLKVVTQDGSEIFFKCRMTTPLQKLMNAFCQRQGVNAASIRFIFDGQRLNPQQTPQELEMEDGDVIDIMVDQYG